MVMHCVLTGVRVRYEYQQLGCSLNNSAAASTTKFREVKSATDDSRVELEIKIQLDKNDLDESHSPVFEWARDMIINNAAAASMTAFIRSNHQLMI